MSWKWTASLSIGTTAITAASIGITVPEHDIMKSNDISLFIEPTNSNKSSSNHLPGVPTPVVSPREISKQPMSYNSLATYATFEGGVGPSTGHPTTHDIYLSHLKLDKLIGMLRIFCKGKSHTLSQELTVL